MKIYADNAATTRVSDTALAAMTPCFQEIYGNPSSLHTPGQRAAEKLAAARAIFARNLHADPREITFTSGGSEADNQALRTAAALGEKRGKRHIVSTKFEHHAVLHTLQALEREGFEVTLLDIPPDGVVTAEQVRDAIRPDTCLVSVMFANNEIGTISPLPRSAPSAARRGSCFTRTRSRRQATCPSMWRRCRWTCCPSPPISSMGPRAWECCTPGAVFLWLR